jgi:hypothetical protein
MQSSRTFAASCQKVERAVRYANPVLVRTESLSLA